MTNNKPKTRNSLNRREARLLEDYIIENHRAIVSSRKNCDDVATDATKKLGFRIAAGNVFNASRAIERPVRRKYRVGSGTGGIGKRAMIAGIIALAETLSKLARSLNEQELVNQCELIKAAVVAGQTEIEAPIN